MFGFDVCHVLCAVYCLLFVAVRRSLLVVCCLLFGCFVRTGVCCFLLFGDVRCVFGLVRCLLCDV